MKNLSKYVVLFMLALLAFTGEVGAKSFGGGGFRSSSFKSSSFKSTPSVSKSSSWFSSKSTPSSFKSTPAQTQKPTVTTTSPSVPVQVNKSQASSFKTTTAVGAGVATGAVVATASTPTTNTPKTNSIDAKLAKNTSVAGKTFTNKNDAESAYRAQLTSKNTYTSSREPSIRPNYVPNNVNVGGKTVHVVYHQSPSGGYGYGYYDPMTHAFVTLAATQMLINASHQAEIDEMYRQQMLINQQNQIAQQQALLAQQQASQVTVTQPVSQPSGHSVWFYIGITLLIVIVVIGIGALLL